jgi:hypothetical protein
VIKTIKGDVKPNRVSWFLWALAPMIAFAAEINQGVGMQSLLAFAVGFGPLCVFLSSFVNKNSFWKIGKLDWICAVFSILGILLWSLTRIGDVAIMFSIFADGIAAVPTIIKSWKAPETESHIVFSFALINAAITLLAIKNWNFANYGFPLYIFLICAILTILIKFKVGNLFRMKQN